MDLFSRLFLADGPGAERDSFLAARAGVAGRLARYACAFGSAGHTEKCTFLSIDYANDNVIAVFFICSGSVVLLLIFVTPSQANLNSLFMEDWEGESVPLSPCQSRGRRSRRTPSEYLER